MQMLHWQLEPQAPATLLCLGAHSDDIEIGCGGTLLKWLAGHPHLTVHWVVFSHAGARAQEARAGARSFLRGAAARTLHLYEFRDGFFPYQGGTVKEAFEELKAEVQPDLILTHYRNDLHQDHRLVSELTRNTWRDHLILEYEVPKYDGDLASPNLFVPLPKPLCRRKIAALVRAFPSQCAKPWFDEELFWGLLRLRGMEAASPSGYAEAFYAHKAVLV